MAYANTIFSQLLSFVPRDQFQRFVGQHDGDRYVKKLTTWNQLVATLYAQATGKDSLREIETGLLIQQNSWRHLGINSIARSSLSHAQNRRSFQIFEQLFYLLLERTREVTPEKSFNFDNPLYSLDATVIKLCLNTFDWAHYTKTKGALKLHTLLNNRTTIPELLTMSEGRKGDITGGKELEIISKLEKGSIVVFDRAYVDYSWWYRLHEAGLFFVSRTKTDMVIDIVREDQEKLDVNILSDREVLIGEKGKRRKYPETLRHIRYLDSTSLEVYEYLTNNFKLKAIQIVEIYKARWQIEIFFRWIKQNLKIKTFLGTSQNAVLSQIWIAMIYYLLLAYIKFQTKFSRSVLELTRMIKETLLTRRPLIDLLSLTSRTVLRIKDPPVMQLKLSRF